MAHFALGIYAVTLRERGAAAEAYHAAITAGGAAAGAGARLGPHATGALRTARQNLAVIAAPHASVAKAVANAAVCMAASAPGDVMAHADGPLPVATPTLCSYCGAHEAEMRCGRCRVARYCNAACQRTCAGTHARARARARARGAPRRASASGCVQALCVNVSMLFNVSMCVNV